MSNKLFYLLLASPVLAVAVGGTIHDVGLYLGWWR